jgi:hypothetical protein
VDVSTVKTGPLRAALAASESAPVRTDQLSLLQSSAALLLHCREALLQGSWEELGTVVSDAERVRIHEAASDELQGLRRELHLHSVIKSVLMRLQDACSSRDARALETALREADSLRLGASPDLHVLARVSRARQLLDRLQAVEQRLRQAVKRSDLAALDSSCFPQPPKRATGCAGSALRPTRRSRW